MTMAMTVGKYLGDRDVSYELYPHMHTPCSIQSAHAAHIPADQLAKGVVVEDDDGYLMVVIPANCHVRFSWLRKATGRNVELASELELAKLFEDCEVGAVPPLGDAYGMATLIDDRLTEKPEIFFESGDHEELVGMSSVDFMRLQPQAMHGHFASPMR